MDNPHNLSDATLSSIAPGLLGHHDELGDIDPDLASATATVLANQVNIDDAGASDGHAGNMMLDPAKWNEFAATANGFYESEAFAHEHGDDGSHIDSALDINQQNVHGEEMEENENGDIEHGVEDGEGDNLLAVDGGEDQSGSPANLEVDPNTTATGAKRKRARRDPSLGGPSNSRKRHTAAVQDPNDPYAHLLLPPNLQGRTVEYATAGLEDTRNGPVFVHPPQGTVQACVRCHGIKRKCEALVWRLKTGSEAGVAGGFATGANGENLYVITSGGVVWEKPRCMGCEKADVPCVFELGAASSG